MEVKKALEHYFQKLLNVWDVKYSTFPQVPWDEDINPVLYLSNPDEEEYVYWKPVEKKELDNFINIEKVLEMTIHHALKEYFNSYLFLNLQGYYGARLVNLEPVEPGKSIVDFFEAMKTYEENKGRQLRYIQVGFVSPEEMAVIFDNETGQIFIENVETEEKEFLVNSLAELITNLKILL
ncbi:SecY-interacting protein Syd [Niallia sp. MER 6]|uniref:SecY-interacting protein Syd n=1 Tax=Niallia sp. MER 6 TaxID=2939567 RepID=UPI00203CEA79|nr:SecY-interacting protein Syd [Niallia sp. MER 6]MCM3033910.1 SecY-interacting protein Syd [Niallia sp. MER 6]